MRTNSPAAISPSWLFFVDLAKARAPTRPQMVGGGGGGWERQIRSTEGIARGQRQDLGSGRHPKTRFVHYAVQQSFHIINPPECTNHHGNRARRVCAIPAGRTDCEHTCGVPCRASSHRTPRTGRMRTPAHDVGGPLGPAQRSKQAGETPSLRGFPPKLPRELHDTSGRASSSRESSVQVLQVLDNAFLQVVFNVCAASWGDLGLQPCSQLREAQHHCGPPTSRT